MGSEVPSFMASLISKISWYYRQKERWDFSVGGSYLVITIELRRSLSDCVLVGSVNSFDWGSCLLSKLESLEGSKHTLEHFVVVISVLLLLSVFDYQWEEGLCVDACEDSGVASYTKSVAEEPDNELEFAWFEGQPWLSALVGGWWVDILKLVFVSSRLHMRFIWVILVRKVWVLVLILVCVWYNYKFGEGGIINEFETYLR